MKDLLYLLHGKTLFDASLSTRKEGMFNLTTHSTHVSLRLYDIIMVNDHIYDE